MTLFFSKPLPYPVTLPQPSIVSLQGLTTTGLSGSRCPLSFPSSASGVWWCLRMGAKFLVFSVSRSPFAKCVCVCILGSEWRVMDTCFSAVSESRIPEKQGRKVVLYLDTSANHVLLLPNVMLDWEVRWRDALALILPLICARLTRARHLLTTACMQAVRFSAVLARSCVVDLHSKHLPRTCCVSSLGALWALTCQILQTSEKWK